MNSKKLRVCAALVFVLMSFSMAAAKPNTGPAAAEPAAAAEPFVITDKVVVVICGYNFNESAFVKDFQTYLGSVVGLEKDRGAVRIVVYPDDFMSGSKVRLSTLSSKLTDDAVCGVILLGAPEKTSDTIAAMKLNVPVFSFFPQDDVLSTEFVSDFILENGDSLRVADAEYIFQLTASAVHFIQSGATLSKDTKLKDAVKKIIGPNWTVSEYTNPETGIRSINHFIVEAVIPVRSGTLQ